MNNRIFAIGDIHGCFDSFKELIEHKIKIKRSDKVILLGDYIDRGTNSKELIDYIIDLEVNGFDVIPVKGNHEAMILEAYENEELIHYWFRNGGEATLDSFGIGNLKNLDSKYLNFFRKLRSYYSFEDYLFVHAGFNDAIGNPFDDAYHMIWMCSDHYTHLLLRDKIIVHAHCPISITACEERITSNDCVINLDTGCVYKNRIGYGRLTALELYTRTIYFV